MKNNNTATHNSSLASKPLVTGTCFKGAAVFKFFLKHDKQYVIRLPFIDGWIYNGDYFFHVWSRTGHGFFGDRFNYGKHLLTLSNF